MPRANEVREKYVRKEWSKGNIVVSDVSIQYHQTEAIKNNIKEMSLSRSRADQTLDYQGYKYSIYQSVLSSIGATGRLHDQVRGFLVSSVNTEERLETANPKPVVERGEPKQKPLQYMAESTIRNAVSGLHPPQARTLGSIMPDLLKEKQAFISTHSIDLIKGLLTSARDRVKIIRITRNGNTNQIKHLNKADVDVIWDDPIMRHSNMIDCLFYEHTVLCESDSDCQLYSLALENLKSKNGKRSDTLFIHCGGKGRMHLISKELNALGVDYRIIPDLDVFNDRGLLKSLVEANGGDWAQLQADYDQLAKAMNIPGETMTPNEYLEALSVKIEERGYTNIAKAEANKISKDAKSILENQWDALKHNGIDYVKDEDVKASLERLIDALNKLKIYPVKGGELENFVPQVGDHGPGWAMSVIEAYPNIGDPVYEKLLEFVNSWGL